MSFKENKIILIFLLKDMMVFERKFEKIKVKVVVFVFSVIVM